VTAREAGRQCAEGRAGHDDDIEDRCGQQQQRAKGRVGCGDDAEDEWGLR
jgi:hypothetical protein